MEAAKLLKTLEFEHPISCHSFNKDLTRVAVAHKMSTFSDSSYDICIYDCQTTKPKLESTLSLHSSHIRCIDWAPESNKIASCSADMNCFVSYEKTPGNWCQTIVYAALKFSASVCKWAPNEEMIAIGSVSGNLRVCKYLPQFDWYGETRLKDQTSAITTLDWTKDSKHLAIGCADRFFKIFCVDPVNPKPIFSIVSPNYGFAVSLATNTKGNLIALYCKDASLTIFDVSKEFSQPNYKITTLNVPPLRIITFADDKTLVCSSVDRMFYKFTVNADMSVKLEGEFGKSTGKSAASVSAGMSAFSKFQNLDVKGTSKAVGAQISPTMHPKCISSMQSHVKNHSVSASCLGKKITIWSC